MGFFRKIPKPKDFRDWDIFGLLNFPVLTPHIQGCVSGLPPLLLAAHVDRPGHDDHFRDQLGHGCARLWPTAISYVRQGQGLQNSRMESKAD